MKKNQVRTHLALCRGCPCLCEAISPNTPGSQGPGPRRPELRNRGGPGPPNGLFLAAVQTQGHLSPAPWSCLPDGLHDFSRREAVESVGS